MTARKKAESKPVVADPTQGVPLVTPVDELIEQAKQAASKKKGA